ncbi:MAG TPA: crosslink repair DNA glycosylase YcaQ family protein [Candidatus Limnocylindrales bacterium]|nr:crosslink repair DNA glycosylase YcaQ family protein [Candidatus Limnocylindrales bacterium]
MMVHQLSRTDARRIALRAQLLDAERPAGLLDLVRHLTMLQLDQTAAVAPSADLVAWSRLGSSYSPLELEAALDRGTLINLRGMARPAEDIALYRAEMAEWPGRGELRDWQEGIREWVDANGACRRDILRRLEEFGPLTSRDFPDLTEVPWKSSGWTNDRNVIKLLDFMEARGEIAIAGRKGRDRLVDLAERIYPEDPVVPFGEALRIRGEKRLRALGLARATGPECPTEPNGVGEVGEPATLDGVGGRWRVDPSSLDGLGEPFKGRAALLSPLDRLVFDRKRMTEIFEFDYQLEMYKPVAKRKWGYFALPILYGDRLVGKLDATADRKAGVLRVDAIHRDVQFDRKMTAAVDHEIKDLACWLELKLVLRK